MHCVRINLNSKKKLIWLDPERKKRKMECGFVCVCDFTREKEEMTPFIIYWSRSTCRLVTDEFSCCRCKCWKMSLNWWLVWRTGGDWTGGATPWFWLLPSPLGESNSRSIVSKMLSLVVVTAVADDDVLLLLGFKKKSKSNVTVDSVKLSVIEADGELTLDGEFQRKLPVFPA